MHIVEWCDHEITWLVKTSGFRRKATDNRLRGWYRERGKRLQRAGISRKQAKDLLIAYVQWCAIQMYEEQNDPS
jgi:hypothetical protein